MPHPNTDPELASRAARLNILVRHHGADHPKVVELRRVVFADQLARHVRRVLTTEPGLTDEQRVAVASLLLPAGRTAVGVGDELDAA